MANIRLAVWRCLRGRPTSPRSHCSMISVKPSSFGRLIGAVRRHPGGAEKLSIFFTLSREIPK